ncbi:MAG: hypothetical protein ABI359_03060 [Ginsengibacter sp.]
MEKVEGGNFLKCAAGTLSSEGMGGILTGLAMIAVGASGPVGWMIGAGLGAIMGASTSC